MKTKTIEVYQCGYCGNLYREKQQADECHQDRTCDDCGTVIGKESYKMYCDKCKEERDLAKDLQMIREAKSMTYELYEKTVDEPCIFWGDTIYGNLDELYEDLETIEVDPEYITVWGTKKQRVEIDPSYIIENFEEDCYQDYQMGTEAADAMHKMFDKWNKEYGEYVYYPDYSIHIITSEL